jgi:hypothetical protein
VTATEVQADKLRKRWREWRELSRKPSPERRPEAGFAPTAGETVLLLSASTPSRFGNRRSQAEPAPHAGLQTLARKESFDTNCANYHEFFPE